MKKKPSKREVETVTALSLYQETIHNLARQQKEFDARLKSIENILALLLRKGNSK